MVKVLIIDDEPLIVKMYASALDKNEFEVIFSLKGDEGIEIAKTNHPDIILLDIMMPEPNGIEVIGQLKANEQTKDIPVVMLTNLAGKFDISFARSKGAVDYWLKNEIKVSNLGQKIKEVLQK